jgi:hypothetical protein
MVLKRNKKAQGVDLATLIAIMFFIGMILFLGVFITGKINDELMNSKLMNRADVNDTLKDITDTGRNLFDFMFLSVVIGSFASILILSFLVDIHPIWSVFFLIAMIVLVLASMVISNSYVEITNNTAFENTQQYFPIQNYIMQNLPIIIFAFGILVAIILYSKTSPYTGGGLQ